MIKIYLKKIFRREKMKKQLLKELLTKEDLHTCWLSFVSQLPYLSQKRVENIPFKKETENGLLFEKRLFNGKKLYVEIQSPIISTSIK